MQKSGTLHSGPRSEIQSVLVLAAALIVTVSTVGCSIRTVSLEAPPTVTEAKAKRDLGADYLSSRRTGMAIRELRASLDLDPTDPETHLWMGEAYRRKGKTDRAEGFLKRSVALARSQKEDRTLQESMLTLSAMLSQVGRYEEALEYCEPLTDDPTVSAPWRPLNNCGWAFMQLGRLDEARGRFVEALDYFPRFGPALMNLGILESKQGHRLKAVGYFERALDARLGGAGIAETNYRLGELYVALGQRQKAVVYFQAAADRAPMLEWGTQSQAYLDLLR